MDNFLVQNNTLLYENKNIPPKLSHYNNYCVFFRFSFFFRVIEPGETKTQFLYKYKIRINSEHSQKKKKFCMCIQPVTNAFHELLSSEHPNF